MVKRRTKQRAKQRAKGPIKQPPWRRLRNPYRPMEILSPDEVEALHDASLDILEQYGIEFRSDEALKILKNAGAFVDAGTDVVRFERGLVEETIAHAPSQFTLWARNPERYVIIGGQHLCFDSVGGPPNGTDVEGGRRMGNFEDFQAFVRLAQSLNVLHLVGGAPVAPIDLDAQSRHLDCNYAYITLTDKAWFTTAVGAERVSDAVAMLQIVHELSACEIREKPCTFSIINVNSPRRFDGPMAEGLIELARNGQVTCVTPFTLCGAMSPITLAGALAQQNAEALAGIVLTQLVNPGAPVIYGGFTSNVDMKTGSPAFGTPEYTKACLAGGQMARRYALPYRSSNVNSSNAVDAQATYESSMSIWGSVLGYANLLHHGAGWLEGGLTASFEKAIIDAEMLQMMAAFLEPIEVSEATLALEAIGGVQPGGHFFDSEHTLSRYETAFYNPLISDWRNFESWEESGALSATERAGAAWKLLLENYDQPPLAVETDDALKAFIRQRKSEWKNNPR
mgnify:CR=1 FL=1